MAKVSIVIADIDADNVVVTLEGDHGDPLNKDSLPTTNAQQIAWTVLVYLEGGGAGGMVKKGEIEIVEPKG